MMKKNDITTEQDITLLVHSFYKKVQQDDVLAPVFNQVIKGSWDAHLQIMCDFWSTILLYSKKYLKDPIGKHLPLAIEEKHFTQWLSLFAQTVDEYFEGNTANEAKKRANAIAKLIKHIKKAEDDKTIK